MTTPGKLSPEDEYRGLKGFGPEVDVPVSLKSETFEEDAARKLEMQREAKEVVKPTGPAAAGSGGARQGAPAKTPQVETLLPRNGPGFKTYSKPVTQYGQQATIAKIEKIARAFSGQSLTPVYLGDIGKKGGGVYWPHKGAGHRDGFGVDIRPSDNLGIDEAVRWDSPNYNRTNTMMLIHEIRRQHPKAVTLFNDPELIRMGLVKPAKGHDNHLHVDFK